MRQHVLGTLKVPLDSEWPNHGKPGLTGFANQPVCRLLIPFIGPLVMNQQKDNWTVFADQSLSEGVSLVLGLVHHHVLMDFGIYRLELIHRMVVDFVLVFGRKRFPVFMVFMKIRVDFRRLSILKIMIWRSRIHFIVLNWVRELNKCLKRLASRRFNFKIISE